MVVSITQNRAVKVAQQVRVLTTNPHGLGLIPRAHIDRPDSQKLSLDFQLLHRDTGIHIYTMNE